MSKASSGVLEAWDRIWHLKGLDFPQTTKLYAASLQSCNLPVLHVNGTLPRGESQIIVLGSEHSGVSKQVLDKCHARVYIPSKCTKAIEIDSLNVSVAAGIILNRFLC